jgi:hypothetical protein
MLAPELADYYKKHGVEGVEDYLSGGPSNSDIPSRFIRVNPRFDREETLRILKVRHLGNFKADDECTLHRTLVSHFKCFMIDSRNFPLGALHQNQFRGSTPNSVFMRLVEIFLSLGPAHSDRGEFMAWMSVLVQLLLRCCLIATM